MNAHTPGQTCNDCAVVDYPTSFVQTSPIKQAMDTHGVCWECGYWRVEVTKPHEVVIDARIYSLGNINKPPGSPYAGMAGRRFDIEFFDGRVVTTHDLWAGSEVPDRLKQQIPDTARFLGGAGFVKVGDGGAWNASNAPLKATGSAACPAL